MEKNSTLSYKGMGSVYPFDYSLSDSAHPVVFLRNNFDNRNEEVHALFAFYNRLQVPGHRFYTFETLKKNCYDLKR